MSSRFWLLSFLPTFSTLSVSVVTAPAQSRQAAEAGRVWAGPGRAPTEAWRGLTARLRPQAGRQAGAEPLFSMYSDELQRRKAGNGRCTKSQAAHFASQDIR